MKYSFTVGFFLLNTFILFAQSDFREGYIISISNDTIYGLIDYKGNKANAKKCVYKENENSENQTFTPDKIKGYRFTKGKFYVSKWIVEENETKQLFLEYLINGIVDIYYYRDNSFMEHYFVDNKSGKLHELKNEEKEFKINGTRYVKDSKEYIGLLKATFRESPSVANKVDHIGLNHKSLINITHDYHTEVCSDGECIIYEKKLPKTYRKFGITAGVGVTTISKSSDYNEGLYFIRNNNYKFKVFPSIGAFYKVNLPFINERTHLQYEGSYSRVEYTNTNSFIEPVYNMNYINDISLKQNAFNNGVILKYEFTKGKIKPTFQMGGFINFIFLQEYNRNLEVKYSWGETYYTNQFNDNPFSKVDYGINAGVGLTSAYYNNKELFLDFKYQRGLGMLRGLSTNTFLVCLGLQIGK